MTQDRWIPVARQQRATTPQERREDFLHAVLPDDDELLRIARRHPVGANRTAIFAELARRHGTSLRTVQREFYERRHPCPGPRCLTMIPADRELCWYCAKTARLANETGIVPVGAMRPVPIPPARRL